jgi:hypothetical protein
MNGLALVGIVGIFCTKTVDFIKHAWPKKVPDWLSVLLSMGVGMVYVLLLNVNVFSALGLQDITGTRALVATGLLVGAMGSGIYEVLDVVSTKTSQIKTQAGVRRN